jgi:hypothetical protein
MTGELPKKRVQTIGDEIDVLTCPMILRPRAPFVLFRVFSWLLPLDRKTGTTKLHEITLNKTKKGDQLKNSC